MAFDFNQGKAVDEKDFDFSSGSAVKQKPQAGDPIDFSLKETAKNILPSAGRMVKDIGSALAHPIKTTKAVGSTLFGAGQSLARNTAEALGLQDFADSKPVSQSEQQANTAGQFFKDRYGGAENIQRTIQEDPVGMLGDASAIFGGGGAVLKGAGEASKISSLAKIGSGIQKVGITTEPLSLMGKGVGLATRYPFGGIRGATGAFLRESLGVSTGVGGGPIREAFLNPTREFRQAMRGQTPVQNIVTAARDGMYRLKDQRGARYRQDLAKVSNSKTPLNIEPYINNVKSALEKRNIKFLENGELDFSRSTIADATEADRIGTIVNEVLNWDDTTPLGLDTLKQRLGDFHTPSGSGRALTTSITSDLRKILIDNVDGYKEMVGNYEEATGLIKEIEGTLSLKSGTRMDTTLRKLTSAMKNDDFRNEFTRILDDLTESDMTQQLSGAALSQVVPAGLVGRSAFITGLTALAAGFIDPKILFGLAATSPRVVGEFLSAAGLSKQAIDSVLKFAGSDIGRQILQTNFQAGRLTQETEDNGE